MEFDDRLPDRLRERLNKPLPGIASCAAFAPDLCYGRHQGPPAHDARYAAVLLLLYPHEGTIRVPLTVRPAKMNTHGGQVSLPGGQLESNETIEQAAIREYHEELGENAEEIQLLGRLSPLYVFASNFHVTPCVAWSAIRPIFEPNPDEVANLLEPELVELMNFENHGEHLIDRRGAKFTAPHVAYQGYKIWGATSVILSEFFQIAEELAD